MTNPDPASEVTSAPAFVAPWLEPARRLSWRERLRAARESAFSVTPSLPAGSPLGPVVADDMVRLAVRRSRIVAWSGILVNLPLFYLNEYLNYRSGLFDDPVEGPWVRYLFAWRVISLALLAAYLVFDARVRSSDGVVRPVHRRMASGFPALFLALGATFGSMVAYEQTALALFALTTLIIAVSIHPPNRSKWIYYALAVPSLALGAGLIVDGWAVVSHFAVPIYVILLLVFVLDRVTYAQLYRNLLAGRMLESQNLALVSTVQELEETRSRLVASERQAERARISRDLHDSVGAQLSSLISGVELAKLGAKGHDSPVSLEDVEADAREAMQQLRETVWALRSDDITVDALAAQVRRFGDGRCRGTDISFSIDLRGELDTVLSATQALNLYRLAQEAIQNAFKHSGAASIAVRLEARDGICSLMVRDDGSFASRHDASDGPPSGFGMASMRSRATELLGTFEVDTTSGTVVSARIPIDQPGAASVCDAGYAADGAGGQTR